MRDTDYKEILGNFDFEMWKLECIRTSLMSPLTTVDRKLSLRRKIEHFRNT